MGTGLGRGEGRWKRVCGMPDLGRGGGRKELEVLDRREVVAVGEWHEGCRIEGEVDVGGIGDEGGGLGVGGVRWGMGWGLPNWVGRRR